MPDKTPDAPHVFLMGTAGSYDDPNRSKWREPFKKACAAIGVTTFDPVVRVWDEEAGKREVEALKKAKILVTVIVPDTAGIAALAESGWTVVSALQRKQKVVLFIDPNVNTSDTRTDQGETVAEASRRARHLVVEHAKSLLGEFWQLGSEIYLAGDLADAEKQTVKFARDMIQAGQIKTSPTPTRR